MFQFLLNTTILHLAIGCYNLIYYYVLMDNKYDFNNNYIVYNNYEQLKLLIKTTIKLILHKELIFRVYLAEILTFILYEEDLLVWILIFSTFNVYYYYYSENIIKISKFFYSLIIAYYLITNNILASIVIHVYSDLLGIIIQKFLFNTFNKSKVKLNIMNEELVSKSEVESLLSTKKFD
jgi:hypothetical protein